MKSIISFIFIVFLINVNVFSLDTNSNIDFNIQKGLFMYKLNDNLIYSYTEEEGEYILYKLYSLNLVSNEKTLIDSSIKMNCCAKISDSTLLFAISNRLFKWNANTNLKEPFLHSFVFNDIIAISYNNENKKAVVFDVDKNNNLTIKVFDEFNNNIFNKKVEVNPFEIEGISPKVESIKSFFVFLIQDKLYRIDLSNDNLQIKLISNKCDEFALNENNSILFYKFISDERETGFITVLDRFSMDSDSIDKKLDEKIYNCSNQKLYSTQINGKNIPAYLICNVFYVFSNNKWEESFDVIIYKDNKLKVSLPRNKGVIEENSFEWIYWK